MAGTPVTAQTAFSGSKKMWFRNQPTEEVRLRYGLKKQNLIDKPILSRFKESSTHRYECTTHTQQYKREFNSVDNWCISYQ